MSLSNSERTQLRQLLQSPQWGSFEHLMKDLLDKWRDEFGAKDTEWETLRNTLTNEGKIKGVTELSQEIYRQIQNEQG